MRAITPAAVLLAWAASASAQTDYAWTQITEFPFGTSVFDVSIAADNADRIAFRTTGSLDGPNDGGNFEIFLYDAAAGDFTQVTNTPFGVGNFMPFITPDGGSIVFRSLFDHVGDGNGGQFEIYDYEIATQTFTRLVDIPGGQVRSDFRMSGDGRFVVFNTAADLTGGNPDGNFEIFRVDRTDGSIVQITDTSSGLRDFPDINGDGSLVVYAQGRDIFLWEESTGATTNLTNNPTGLRVDMPQVSNDGRYVVFYSLYAGFDPSAPSANGFYVLDRQTGLFDQVVFPALDNDDNDPFTLEMSPDGSAVFFETDRLGTIRDLYRYNTSDGTIDRVTTSTALVGDSALATDATRRYISISNNNTIAYRSEQPTLDPDVSNASGTNLDLFVASLPTAEPCPGDTNGDNQVNTADLLTLLANFGQSTANGAADGDLDESGVVNTADLLTLLSVFGTGC